MSYKSIIMKKEVNWRDSLSAALPLSEPEPGKPIGPRRTLLSALAISLGLFLVYVALHYIPAHIRPVGVVGLTTENGRLTKTVHKKSPIPVIGNYLDAFQIRRTFLREGQTLEARFIVPEGSEIQLHVRQCRSAFGVEVFYCDVTSHDTVTIVQEGYGRRTLTAPRDGFYYFDERVKTPEADAPYKIVWART